MPLLGMTISTATMVVVLSIAALGRNMMVGRTGLVSFGHGAWFGIGAYAAALSQRHVFEGQIVLPILFAMAFTGLAALPLGALTLRRRGIYFSLMTLALTALVHSIAFRWTEFTGGAGGLGGMTRGPAALDDGLAYYIFAACIGFATLYGLLRVTRSPFGHAMAAIRENQQRAAFQGFGVQSYKLAVFVMSAMVTALAGALSGFLHLIVSADATSVQFSGELLAMVMIGGMRGNILGPAIGVLFYVLFRELFSFWTEDWLFWFGLVFVAFVMYSPGGLAGVWRMLRRRLRPPPVQDAAMSRPRIDAGMPLPAFLRPAPAPVDVLTVHGVSRSFRGIRAVQGASLRVKPGDIHALIGPNGAGKTTLFNVICGLYAPDQGAVRLMGRDLHGRSIAQICHAGLSRSFQMTNLFEGLSVAENLRLSAQAKHPGRHNFWRDAAGYDDINADTAELIKFIGLEGMEDIRAGALSHGGQRLVDLGIALASKPQVLLLDEPLAGLSAAERERVGRLISTMARNIPVLIVEHDIDRVLTYSHEVTVMNEGEVLVTGKPGDIRADARVQHLYTGSGTPTALGRRSAQDAPGEVVLKLDRVSAFYGKSRILTDTSLDVRRGEIVALLGRNGAGKTTCLRTIAGLMHGAAGSVTFEGQELIGMEAHDIARAGIGYVPQGRGLFHGMTVRENLALGRLARNNSGAIWSEARIFEIFPRLAKRIDTDADFLSGGERQMLAVARALSGDVRLLLLDEPFEGLSPNVIEDLFRVFDRLRETLPILIVEHNLDLVLALSDRVFALENGTVFHECDAHELLTDLDYRKRILWL
jgi:ABC-type branched-subunit amino acid transport system ATPase component/ABC-type branched-subunit amino acid transport system permease subunit